MSYIKNYNDTYFFTATILEWKHLLKPDKYKDIILSTLKYLVDNKRVKFAAVVGVFSNNPTDEFIPLTIRV